MLIAFIVLCCIVCFTTLFIYLWQDKGAQIACYSLAVVCCMGGLPLVGLGISFLLKR